MRRIVQGDQVVVISGNDKGKRGKVTRIIADQGAIVVEGVHRIKKHVRAQGDRPGGIIEVDAPIPECKVMPVDPKSGEPTRVKFETRDGKKVRVAKSGELIVAQK
jgi:large subunit ribosomal protein L24